MAARRSFCLYQGRGERKEEDCNGAQPSINLEGQLREAKGGGENDTSAFILLRFWKGEKKGRSFTQPEEREKGDWRLSFPAWLRWRGRKERRGDSVVTQAVGEKKKGRVSNRLGKKGKEEEKGGEREKMFVSKGGERGGKKRKGNTAAL